MRRLLVCVLLSCLLSMSALSRQQPAPHVVATDPLSPAEEAKEFRLPEGFEVQLVASEPDIRKPLNLAFDDQGRLWVTDTIEYPFPAPKGKKPRDSVKILSDFGPDGKARKITTFADELNIPIGVLPLPGASPRNALVFSIPNIYRLQDTTGNNRADKRDIFYSTYEFRDTHGMTNSFLHGFDGWVYACHGFSNRSTVKGRDAQAITMQSGNTYRMRADGSHLEQFTWGQVNPFGMAIDPYGYLYTADCHSEPIYQLIRGGYYPSFGKPHDGLNFAPRMFSQYKGSTAVAGMALYAADAFPAAYQGSAFVGDVMTNQIVQFKITWTGATPKATQHVLLESQDRWFRPVDVKLGPDGALYVADFYNRIIGHYEVPLTHPGRDRERGRIWRIVYKGQDSKQTGLADYTRMSVPELIKHLDNRNLTVRLFATHQLAHRGKKAAKAVRESLKDGTAWRQAHGLWVLERTGELDDEVLTEASAAKDDLVRTHVQRILAERGKWSDKQRDLAVAGLKDKSAHVQRAAAEALGLHANAANLRPLLDLRHKVPPADTHLLHTVRIALRNQLRQADTWKGIPKKPDAQARELKWSEKDARAIAEVALGVHSAEASAFLLGHVKEYRYPLNELSKFVHHIARHARDRDAVTLVAFCRNCEPDASRHQATLLRAIDRGTQERGAVLPKEARSWATDLTCKLLDSKRDQEVQLGIELTANVRLLDQQDRLINLVKASATKAHCRLAALQALITLDAKKHATLAGKILVDASQPIEQREQVAGLLARANQPETQAQLLAALPTVPARLQNSIAAALGSSPQGAELLLKTITSGKASARLLQERGVIVRLESARVPRLKERLVKLTAGLPPADAKLGKLLAERRKGFLTAKTDVTKGAAVFEKSCAICHQLGGKGAKIGPQLDGIGLRGLDRLLEDTLDPNRNVDAAFRTTNLTLLSGQVVQGLFLREEGAVLVLADQQGKEVRVAKKDVEMRSVSPISPMPANFVDQVSAEDFNNLIAYLLAQKPAKP